MDDWDLYNGIIRDVAEMNCCVLNDQTEYLKEFHGPVNIRENGLHLTADAQVFLAIKFMETMLNAIVLR